jgi:MarR family transcriptional regulator, temperature-dependent positive regulator of motility
MSRQLTRPVSPKPQPWAAPIERQEACDTSGGVPPNHRVPSFLAFRFHQLCLGIMAEVLAPAVLKSTEYGALTMLDAEPGLDQQSLAARLGIDKVSAGQLIDRLERNGFVSRSLHPTDRRARVLNLTPEGLTLRRRIQPAALAAQDRILAPLRAEDRMQLINLLTTVVEGHSEYARPGNGRLPPRKRSPGN